MMNHFFSDSKEKDGTIPKKTQVVNELRNPKNKYTTSKFNTTAPNIFAKTSYRPMPSPIPTAPKDKSHSSPLFKGKVTPKRTPNSKVRPLTIPGGMVSGATRFPKQRSASTTSTSDHHIGNVLVEDVSTERGRLFLKITRPNHTAPTTKV
jgi:hypothetical protein